MGTRTGSAAWVLAALVLASAAEAVGARYWVGMPPDLAIRRIAEDRRAAKESAAPAGRPELSFGPSLDNLMPPGPSWTNVQCDAPPISRAAETFIDADPNDPQHVVAGSNTYSGWPHYSGCYFSTDGGASFANTMIPNLVVGATTYTSGGDPMVMWDTLGNVFYVSLGYSTNVVNYASRSTDNGASWTAQPLMDLNTDKPFACADVAPASPYKDSLYCVYVGGGGIRVSYSRNQGATWSTPVVVSAGAAGTPHTPSIATGPGGEVYVLFRTFLTASPALWFCRSTNGGASFSAAQNIHTLIGALTGFYLPPMPPCLAVDVSGGAYSGTVYAAYDDRIAVGQDWDAWVRRTTDGGTTWSAQVRVNDDLACNGRRQNFPFVRTGRSDGIVTAYWYDGRHTTSDFAYYYVAQSSNGGQSFGRNVRVSDFDTYVCPSFTSGSACRTSDGRFVGDYEGGCMSSTSVHPIWADARIGPQTVAHVYTQRVPHPVPQIAGVSPMGAAAGQSGVAVTVAGTGMQPQGNAPTGILFNEPGITGTVTGSSATSVTLSVSVAGGTAAGISEFSLVYANGVVKADPVFFHVLVPGQTPTATLTPPSSSLCGLTATATVSRTGTRTASGSATSSATRTATATPTPVAPPGTVWPNPFVRGGPSAVFFGLSPGSWVAIYTAAGERVARIESAPGPWGFVARWDGVLPDGFSAAAGIYVYVLHAEGLGRTTGVLAVR